MMEGYSFVSRNISVSGFYVEVEFKDSVDSESKELESFVSRMNKYGYRMGLNNES